MASKVTLTQIYNTTITNYGTLLNSDMLAIQVAINQVIDELRAVNASNAVIAQDALLPDSASAVGRFGVEDARLTFTIGATTIQVSSGVIYIAGQRVTIVGATVPGFIVAGTSFIAVTLDGLMSRETTASQQAFDLATVVQAGITLADGDVTDNLSFDSGSALNTANTLQRLYERLTTAGTPVAQGVADPIIRTRTIAGVDEDAGLYRAAQSEIGFASQHVTSEGVGAAVEGMRTTARGQLQLFEQSRLMLTDSTASAGTADALTALNMSVVRQEPASYLSGTPWGAGPATSFSKPTGTQYDGTYQLSAFVEFNSAATGWLQAEILVNSVRVAYGTIQMPTSGTTPIGAIPLAALVDITGTQTVELRAAVTAGTLTITNALLGLHLIGGRATP